MINFTYIQTEAELAAALPEIMSKPVWGVDTETSGLDPHKDKVNLLQIGNIEKQFVIDTRKTSLEPLRPFLESTTIKKVGHNFKFDYKMLKGSAGIDTEAIRDTMIADKVLNVGRKNYGYGLDDVLAGWLGIKVDKSLQKSFIGHTGDYSAEQLTYAAADVEYLIELVRKQSIEIERVGLRDTFLLECDVLPCFGDMEFAGVMLDRSKWLEVVSGNLQKAKSIEKDLSEIASAFYQTDMFGNIATNWGSPKQVVDFLQRMKIVIKEEDFRTGEITEHPITDSSDATLKKITGYPVVDLLKKWRSCMVRVNTFGQSFIDVIHPVTGRIHPEFDQLGTDTGRPTAHKRSPVNMLNIPRDKTMRNCFVCPEGYLVETDDYSGCELRIWAELSQDENLLIPLRQGIDLHCYAATKLFNVEVTKKNENAKLRTPAKTINFGTIYGMGPSKLYWKINSEGYPITMQETKDLYRKYTQEEFSTGIAYLRTVGKRALEDGYLANLNGRRRYWIRPNPDDREKYPMGENDPVFRGRCASIEREGGNFMVQSVNADMTKAAMVAIRKYKKEYRVRTEFMNAVYDEIVTITHKDDSENFREVKRNIMIDVSKKWIKSVPIEVEGEVLPYWTK